ncbi:MAG: hypothetical protein N4R36_02410 [Lactobacillus crispatus]|nr:hypothetical protein [Lactobacillus crispatus]MCT7769790.1 hypothetical protein [Lactobacillus crispatus]
MDFKGENYVFSINYDSGCCLHMWVDVIHPLSSFGRQEKNLGLRLAQSFFFVCLGTVTVLFVLWMPHVHDIIAVLLAILFIIVPVLFVWSAGVFLD